MTAKTNQGERVLVMRVCRADMTSRGGFRWPASGPVEAPDWRDNRGCGNGLHGWLWGEGDVKTAGNVYDSEGARWLAVSVLETEIVRLDGKVKFPRGEVVAVGEAHEIAHYIASNGGNGRAIIHGVASAGDGGTATVGDRGTATAGAGGTATACNGGVASAGKGGKAIVWDGGTATVGDEGTAIAGLRGTASAGHGGKAIAGDGGTATAGYEGEAFAGDEGTAIAGDGGIATAGHGGTATAGYEGVATAGNGGTIQLSFFDSKRGVLRRRCAEVGEGGLTPNVAYRLDSNGQFVCVDGGVS